MVAEQFLPFLASDEILTKESVVPDMADSTVTFACSCRIISATFLIFVSEPTEVPPNFSTLLIVFILMRYFCYLCFIYIILLFSYENFSIFVKKCLNCKPKSVPISI